MRYHTDWIQWNSFDGAWLIENDSYTEWAFRQPGPMNVRHGSLDDPLGIPDNVFPTIVYPSGLEP